MQYRREIDGLRAVAVIPVILFHAGFEFLSGGFVGVDIFFVISGYLITSIIISEIEKGEFSIVRFYERRARRILPALFLVMLVCIPFAWLWMMPSDFEDFSESLVAVVFFASNFLFWAQEDYFSPAAELKPLLHTWSLAVEEQYYLLFPLIMMAAWRIGRHKVFLLIAFLGLGSLALSEYASRFHGSANFYFAPTRAWELLAGSICAFLTVGRAARSSNLWSAVGLGLIVYAILFYDEQTPFPSVYALAPVLGASFIILFADYRTFAGKLLAQPILVGIGLVSYSAYLWHQPLFAFARLRSIDAPGKFLMLALAAASLLLAYVTWRFVEQPFRNKGSTFLPTRRSIFAASSVVAAVLVSIGFSGVSSNGSYALSGSLPSFVADARFARNDRTYCLENYDKFNAALAIEHCSVETGSDKAVVLLGDSHADQYVKALRAGATSVGYNFHQLTVTGCMPFRGMVSVFRKCDNNIPEIRDSLSKINPDLVIVSGRWSIMFDAKRFDNGEGGAELGPMDPFVVEGLLPSDPDYNRQLADLIVSSIENLAAEAKSVLILYPTPEAGWHVSDRYAKLVRFSGTAIENISISTSFAAFLSRSKLAIDALDRVNGSNIFRFKPSDHLCNTVIVDRCINAIGRDVYYFDADHLSFTGSDFIEPPLLSAVRNALYQGKS